MNNDTTSGASLSEELLKRFGTELHSETLGLLNAALHELDTLCDAHHDATVYALDHVPATPEGRRCVAVLLASHLLIHHLMTPHPAALAARGAVKA